MVVMNFVLCPKFYRYLILLSGYLQVLCVCQLPVKRATSEAGALPLLKDLLSSNLDNVREQATWAIGNIAGDSLEYRDLILSHGVMEPLLHNIAKSIIPSELRKATRTLSNLCRGEPKWDLFSCALPTLARLIFSTDEEVLTDACWAFSFLSEGPNERIQTPAIRVVGNIVAGGDDCQTQIILNVSVLSCLFTLLFSPKNGIRKEACWAISNITAGNRSQIQAVIKAQIIPHLVTLLQYSDFDVKKEAACAISNAISYGSPKQIRYLVDCHIIEPMCKLLTNTDKCIIIVLEALGNIFDIQNSIKETCQILKTIHNLPKELITIIIKLFLNVSNSIDKSIFLPDQ